MARNDHGSQGLERIVVATQRKRYRRRKDHQGNPMDYVVGMSHRHKVIMLLYDLHGRDLRKDPLVVERCTVDLAHRMSCLKPMTIPCQR